MIGIEGGVVHGHRLQERLGGGHFGEVWKAEYLGQVVALKVFKAKPGTIRNEVFAQYALGRLTGPEAALFPRVEHFDLEADPPYMRMEFVAGKALEEVLEDPKLPLERRLDMGLKLLEALEIVHRNEFVHGDLSPMNVLVTPEGAIKLIDVGFGKVINEGADLKRSESEEMQEEHLGVASPLYAAPERFKAEFLEGCGKSADVFSFGKVLYRIVTGESPFVVKPVSLRHKALGSPWDDYIFKCLEEQPEGRFADASEALAKYREILQPAKGEYRTTCPRCRKKQEIAAGLAGARISCEGCRSQLEVLLYDEESREATCDFVMAFEEGPAPEAIVFLERARKFCPACGGAILVEAKKCRHCQIWVDEVAKKVDTRMRRRLL